MAGRKWDSWVISHQDNPGLFTQRVKGLKRESRSRQGLFMSKFRTGTKLLLLHSIGYRKLKGQPKFKAWGNRGYHLLGGAAQSPCSV